MGDWIACAATWHPATRLQFGVAVAWMLVLFALGCAMWVYFFNRGAIQLDLHDWGEVTSPRTAFLKDAVSRGMLPLHMPGPWALRNVTDRFLAVADTNLAPQILLLRWLSVGQFFVANTIVLFAVGFAGLVLAFRRLRLSLVVWTALFLLTFFNGHITAHLAVGHANWGAYFLLPFFGLLVFAALESPPGWRWTLACALLLLAIFLQGAYHLFVMALLFIGLLGVASRRLLWPMIRAALFAVLVSAFRVLPPLLELGRFDTEFRSGFTDTLQMVSAFVLLKVPVPQEVSSHNPLNPLGWWELDYYIGLAGFLALAGLAGWAFLRSWPGRESPRPLLLPILALIVLSAGKLYQVVHLLQLPMLDSQRVSSRLLYLPFLILAMLGLLRLQDWLSRRRPSAGFTLMLLGGLALLASDITQHFKLWRVERMADLFPNKHLDLAVNVVANHPDPAYHASLLIGAAISLASFIALAILAWMEWRRSPASPARPA